jgi:hypothetical protein
VTSSAISGERPVTYTRTSSVAADEAAWVSRGASACRSALDPLNPTTAVAT